MSAKVGYVYIMTNRRNGTLYLGVTSHLARRVQEHKDGSVAGFSGRYGTTLLVWHESFATITEAIETEKRLKKWRRAWKITLIEEANPEWRDLYADL